MKKLNGKKLALHRETLASLSSDVLGDVVGGTGTTIRPLTRLVCPPTRLVCPPQTLIGCNTTPQAGGAAGGNGAKGGE